jgi:1,2-diacylglycerol 3-alpha-glucosyltransferase
MTTVAVLFINYGPYHFGRLEGFHQVCSKLGWKAIGIELARKELTYAWQADSEKTSCQFISIVDGASLEKVSFFQLTRRLYRTLAGTRLDVLAVAGYSPLIMLLAMFWGQLNRKPVILMSASKENDESRSPLQELIKSLLLKCYHAALVGGSPQKRYLSKLGMPDDKIFTGYNVVDNQSFSKEIGLQYQRPIKKPFFLTINRFIQKKNLFRLISAYSIYRKLVGNNAWDLVLCGDGELRNKLEKHINDLNIVEFVHLTGFLQHQEQLPYFSHASCFIHASTQEQWGLVVNEAMSAGLPVIISNKCGCYEDLIIEGKTGFGFDPEDENQLANIMMVVSDPSFDLTAIGKNAKSHIDNFSPTLFGDNLVKAVKCCLEYS